MKIFLAATRQLQCSLGVAHLEEPAVADVTNQAVGADQLVGKKIHGVLRGVGVGVADLNTRVAVARVIHVQPHVPRRVVFLHPRGGGLLTNHLRAGPPERQINLVHTAVHHRAALFKAPDTPRQPPAREIILSGFFSSVGVWPHHIVEPHMEAKVDEVMQLLEIEHLADRPTNELSSGEAHRVVIGRALVNDPRALVLDEPSTSLDIRATRELRELLRKLAAAGKTLVLVTHQLPDLIPEMRRVILMRDGQVFRDGPTPAVLTSAHLSELFGLPLEVVEKNGYYHLW